MIPILSILLIGALSMALLCALYRGPFWRVKRVREVYFSPVCTLFYPEQRFMWVLWWIHYENENNRYVFFNNLAAALDYLRAMEPKLEVVAPEVDEPKDIIHVYPPISRRVEDAQKEI